MKVFGFGETGYTMATAEQGAAFKAVIGSVAMQGYLVQNSWAEENGHYSFHTEIDPNQIGQLHPETIDRLMVFSDEEQDLGKTVVQLVALAPQTTATTYIPGLGFSHQCILSRQTFDAAGKLQAINTALFYASEPTLLNPSGLQWDFTAAVLQRPLAPYGPSQIPHINRGTSGHDEVLKLEQQLIPSTDEAAQLITFATHQTISS